MFFAATTGETPVLLMEQLSLGLGRTIPLACGDWAATKAAYRFLDNDRVSEADILAGHFASTRRRSCCTTQPSSPSRAMMCILSWRVLWLTMVNRTSPELPAKLVFTETEMKLLEHVVPAKDGTTRKTVGRFLTLLARLGGYLNRNGDGPPGNMAVARHGQTHRHPPGLLPGAG